MSIDPGSFVLPPQAVLLHVGPHKTGTTTVQGSAFDARKRLARHGVLIPYDEPHPRSAVRAATGHRGVPGGREPSMAAWQAVVGLVRQAHDKRVFVSSEMFATAEDGRVDEVIGDLGPDRVWVVITLRPLSRILPSQWQQLLRHRVTLSFHEWLDLVVRQPDSRVARDFWSRHDHGSLIRKWTRHVGADRVVVVVADDKRPESLIRCFEQLLGAPSGTLRLGQRTNRSFTVGEAELVRLLNVEASLQSIPDDRHDSLIRDGLCNRLQARTPHSSDARIELPGWAWESVKERQAAIVAEARSSGARVLGDVDRLCVEPSLASPSEPAPIEEVIRLLSRLSKSDQAMTAIRAFDIRSGLRHLRPANRGQEGTNVQ